MSLRMWLGAASVALVLGGGLPDGSGQSGDGMWLGRR